MAWIEQPLPATTHVITTRQITKLPNTGHSLLKSLSIYSRGYHRWLLLGEVHQERYQTSVTEIELTEMGF